MLEKQAPSNEHTTRVQSLAEKRRKETNAHHVGMSSMRFRM